MNGKTVVAMVFTLVMVTSAFYVFSTVDPINQSISVNVVNQDGVPIHNASVQGMMIRPKSSGGGFVTVFKGMTNSRGVFSTTGISGITSVLSMWEKAIGPSVKASSPDVLLFITYSSSKGIYFRQSSLSLPSDATIYSSVISGRSLSSSVSLDLAATPSLSYPSGLPEPPGTGTEFWAQVNCEATGTIQIPLSWITTSSNTVGCVDTIFSSTQSTSFNVGLDLGTGSNGIQTSSGFQIGGTIWSNTADFGYSSQLVSNGGSAYVYMCAQAAGALFREYRLIPHGGVVLTDNYQYDTGIINPSTTNEGNVYAISGGHANGNPPYISEIDKNFSYRLYSSTAKGTGDYQNPSYSIYSNNFVSAFANSDTQWMSVGIDVGAILMAVLDLSEPEVGIPISILLSITGSVASSSTAVSLSYSHYDASSDYLIYLEVMVGNTQYSLNGGSGNIPLFGIHLSAVYYNPAPHCNCWRR